MASCVSRGRHTGERADDTAADDKSDADGTTKPVSPPFLKPENQPDYTDLDSDGASTDEMTDYASIKRKLLQTPGALFEDQDFPASSSSLYFRSPWSSSLIEWKRPGVSAHYFQSR